MLINQFSKLRRYVIIAQPKETVILDRFSFKRLVIRYCDHIAKGKSFDFGSINKNTMKYIKCDFYFVQPKYLLFLAI